MRTHSRWGRLAVVVTLLWAGMASSAGVSAAAHPGVVATAPDLGARAVSLRSLASPGTTVRRVSPVDRRGRIRAGYRVTKNRRGYCWTTSFLHGRAYRCMTRSLIMDPCWKVSARTVACLPKPWSRRVTRMRLTRRLPATSRPRASAWGLRLGGGLGVRCQRLSGATGGFSYQCGNRWLLRGAPDRRTQPWTIRAARQIGYDTRPRGRKPIRVAWVPVVRR